MPTWNCRLAGWERHTENSRTRKRHNVRMNTDRAFYISSVVESRQAECRAYECLPT